MTYLMEMDFTVCFQSVQAKPFFVNFSRQLQGVKPLQIRYEEYLDSLEVLSTDFNSKEL